MESYDMTNKRGLCIVFSHSQYDKKMKLKPRNGTTKDESAIKYTFKEKLGFKCKMYFNERKQFIFDTLCNAFSNAKEYNSIVVFILTHGSHNYELGAYDGTYDLKQLIADVLNSGTDNFDGIPKVFIIQACAGNNKDFGISSTVDSAVEDGVEEDAMDEDERDEEDAREEENVGEEEMEVEKEERGRKCRKVKSEFSLFLPNVPDLLLARSSPPGYLSKRNPRSGSWFIQTLCRAVLQFGDRHHLEKLLTITNRCVADKTTSKMGEKQIPISISTLTKRLSLTQNAVADNSHVQSNF